MTRTQAIEATRARPQEPQRAIQRLLTLAVEVLAAARCR
jgi:hypothetical protein